MSKPPPSQLPRGAAVSTLERGHIYFAYRPRVDVTVVRGPDDVQRLNMILSPRGRDSYRLLVVGEKRLPAPDGDRRTWAFVDKVSRDPEEIEDELDPRTYLTRTRGLPATILDHARTLDVVREGPHGSAWFAHTDHHGRLTGIEMRGPSWRGFSADGDKSLFRLTGSGSAP